MVGIRMSLIDDFKPFQVTGVPLSVNPSVRIDGIHEDGIIHQNGRFFIKTDATLPLNAQHSPVMVEGIWVEVEREQVDGIINTIDSKDPGHARLSSGTLARDLPGIQGTNGARVSVLMEMGKRPQIVGVADARIPRGKLPEARLLGVYRKTWGNPSPVFTADETRRNQVVESIETKFGSDIEVREVEIPPPFLGNTPPEVLVAKTENVYTAVTVGASYMQNSSGSMFEVIVEMNEVSDDLLETFSEFCFLPGYDAIKPGTVIGVKDGCFNELDFSSWLIWTPFRVDEPSFVLDGNEMSFLQAVPLYPEEMYLAIENPREMAEKLSRADVGDMDRPACL